MKFPGLIINVAFINNDGAGFADFIDVPSGTTVAELFHNRIKNGSTSD